MEDVMLSLLHNSHRHIALSIACACALTGAAVAEGKKSTPTNEQIYCQNRAVNDYWDQVKACDNNLSDIPDQLALCKSDAMDDLKRAKSACLAAKTSQMTINKAWMRNSAVLATK